MVGHLQTVRKENLCHNSLEWYFLILKDFTFINCLFFFILDIQMIASNVPHFKKN